MELILISVALSYLVGSIPNAYFLGKLRGIDIRKFGSGNVGATNAFRVLGPLAGISALLLDALKGFVSVVFLADYFIRQGIAFDGLFLRILLGVVSVLGHSLSIFLRFKGGKGIATTLGVLIGLSFKIAPIRIILGIEILIWFIVFLLTRIVSLASLISAVCFPIFFVLFKQPLPLIIMSFILSILIILRHRSNITRLLRNQEPRLKTTKQVIGSPS